MSKLGQPTSPASAKGAGCEEVTLPFECENDTDETITLTCEQLVAKAIAGATANGITWPNGDAITAEEATGQFEHSVTVCVVCENTPVKLDDGTTFVVTCDAGSLCVNPNGGTNGTAYSCGSDPVELGGGPLEPGEQIEKADTVEILPGGAITGEVKVGRCP